MKTLFKQSKFNLTYSFGKREKEGKMSQSLCASKFVIEYIIKYLAEEYINEDFHSIYKSLLTYEEKFNMSKICKICVRLHHMTGDIKIWL